MFKDQPILSYYKYSLAAALLYFIPVCIFAKDESFTATWLLYVGNMLFACIIVAFILLYNKKRKKNAAIGKLVLAGHITTVMGIITACILISVLAFIFVPDLVHFTGTKKLPPQIGSRSSGLLQILFMNAIFGNISVGSFFSIILAYASKRNQTGNTSVIKKNNE